MGFFEKLKKILGRILSLRLIFKETKKVVVRIINIQTTTLTRILIDYFEMENLTRSIPIPII